MSDRTGGFLLLAAWIMTVMPLHAQTPAKASTPVPANVLTETAATLTGAALTRHLGVLAHDSMHNRETPSAALDRVLAEARVDFKTKVKGDGMLDYRWVE